MPQSKPRAKNKMKTTPGWYMQVRLRPGMRLLWRDATTVQVSNSGLDGVVFENVRPDEIRLLEDLQIQGAANDRSHPVLAKLHDADLLLPMARLGINHLSHSLRARLQADARALSTQSPGGIGWPVLSQRQRSAVEVRGLGRTGALLTRLLAHSGLGEILIADDTPIVIDDLSPGGYSSQDLGQRRATALRAALQRDAPEISIGFAGSRHPDLCVLIAHHAVNPIYYQRLMRHDVAHIAIVLSEGRATVGPFVIPGQTPCLQCLDLHRLDIDPAWPMLATQLMNIELDEQCPEESVLAGLVAHLGAGQILSAIAGSQPLTTAATMELTVTDYVPALREWSIHPDCGCTGVP